MAFFHPWTLAIKKEKPSHEREARACSRRIPRTEKKRKKLIKLGTSNPGGNQRSTLREFRGARLFAKGLKEVEVWGGGGNQGRKDKPGKRIPGREANKGGVRPVSPSGGGKGLANTRL